MNFPAITLLRSRRLQSEDRITEIQGRAFQVDDGKRTHVVVVAPGNVSAWCTCGTSTDRLGCPHIGAALLTIREEASL